MRKTLTTRLVALEAMCPVPRQALPRWAIECKRDEKLGGLLWDAADGEDAAIQALKARFGLDAEPMIEQYSVDRRRVMDMDDC